MTASNSILNASLISKIENYISENDTLTFKIKGFPENINVYYFTFPDSFEHADGKRQLKNAKLNSFYELCNIFNKKLEIDEIDLKEVEAGDQYGFLNIYYNIKPSKYASQFFRYEKNSLFIKLTGDPDIFKMAFKKGFFVDYVNAIITSEAIDIDNPENEIHKEILLDFEKILYGICQKINIEIPKEIDISKLEDSLIKTPDLENFIEFLVLSTRNSYDLSAFKKDAKRLQKLFEKGYDDYKYAEKFRKILSEYFLVEDEVVVYDSFFNSDWKFDPEDLIAIVETITGNQFTFDYPIETYSHELFPYVQKALAKQNLELMSVDCHGDNYFFFIANKNEVNRILELSQIIGLATEKLLC